MSCTVLLVLLVAIAVRAPACFPLENYAETMNTTKGCNRKKSTMEHINMSWNLKLVHKLGGTCSLNSTCNCGDSKDLLFKLCYCVSLICYFAILYSRQSLQEVSYFAIYAIIVILLFCSLSQETYYFAILQLVQGGMLFCY